MRATIIIKEDLLAKASALTGVKEKTAFVHMGLEALICIKRRLKWFWELKALLFGWLTC